MITFLKNNKDYKYSFPYGHYANPQIKILSGKYKGLIFDIECSSVVTQNLNSSLSVNYKIINFWDDNIISIKKVDKEFICHATYNFIRDYNFQLKKAENDITSIT